MLVTFLGLSAVLVFELGHPSLEWDLEAERERHRPSGMSINDGVQYNRRDKRPPVYNSLTLNRLLPQLSTGTALLGLRPFKLMTPIIPTRLRIHLSMLMRRMSLHMIRRYTHRHHHHQHQRIANRGGKKGKEHPQINTHTQPNSSGTSNRSFMFQFLSLREFGRLSFQSGSLHHFLFGFEFLNVKSRSIKTYQYLSFFSSLCVNKTPPK